MKTESLSTAECARLLASVLRDSTPEEAERVALTALKSVKLSAYQEVSMAAKFHAGPMGGGLDGLVQGISRSIEIQEAEVRRSSGGD